MNILFVCTGNVSRSYLAQQLLKHEIEEIGADEIHISSVGLYAYDGNPPDPIMVTYLKEKEIPIGGHSARLIAEHDVDWADIILVMEKMHLEAIGERWPGSCNKMKLLGEYIAGDLVADDIIDPYGKSPYHYRLAQSQITLAVRAFAQTLRADIK